MSTEADRWERVWPEDRLELSLKSANIIAGLLSFYGPVLHQEHMMDTTEPVPYEESKLGILAGKIATTIVNAQGRENVVLSVDPLEQAYIAELVQRGHLPRERASEVAREILDANYKVIDERKEREDDKKGRKK